MARIAVITFGPFGGREVNGSSTVGAELTWRRNKTITHIVLPVVWSELQGIGPRLFSRFTRVVGLGEGFRNYVSVERYAIRETVGKDETQLTADPELLPAGPQVLGDSALRWQDGCKPALLQLMGFEAGTPGIISGSFAGAAQCNGLFYSLLHEQQQRSGLGCGFIHLPPQQEWQERTKCDATEYKIAFTEAVQTILQANLWL